jgi:hypothetical protein
MTNLVSPSCGSIPALAFGALLLAAAPAWSVPATLLEANFNDKIQDELIGFGGAEVGEPVDYGVTIDQHVRGLPFPTNCLEIDDYTGATESIRFEFLEDVAVVTGRIDFRFWVQFDELSTYAIRIRERETAAVEYLDLTFAATGTIGFDDEGGFGGIIGNYVPDEFYEVVIQFDLDEGVYRVEWDGVFIVEEREFSIPGGIGAILFSTPSDADGFGAMYIDDLQVRAPGFSTSTGTQMESASWGRVKAEFR